MERIDAIGLLPYGPPGSIEVRRIGLLWRSRYFRRRRRLWLNELDIFEVSQGA
jgi:hypothetical protein